MAAADEAVKLPLHPNYKAWRSDWRAFRDFEDGSRRKLIREEYLPQHKSDTTDEAQAVDVYGQRLDNTFNNNIVGPALMEHLDTMVQEMTVKGFGGEDGAPWEQQILENVDGYGESAQNSLTQISRLYLRDGWCGILVEADAELPENGDRISFQSQFEALDIPWWRYFDTGPKRGQLRDLILHLKPIFVDEDRAIYRAKRYTIGAQDTAYQWTLYHSPETTPATFEHLQFHEVDKGEVEIDRIPFVAMGCGIHESIVKDAVEANRYILRLNSSIGSVHNHQGFPKPIISGVKDPTAVQAVAEYQALVLPDQTVKVDQLDPGSTEQLRAERDFQILWGRRAALRQMKQLLNDSTKQVQSAESRAKDLNTLQQFYNRTLDRMEKWLSDVYRLHMRFENDAATDEDLQEIRVNIGRDFRLADTELELAKDSLLMSWLDQTFAPDIAHAVKREIPMRYVADMRIVADDAGEEEEKRKELLQQMAKSGPGATAATKLRDTVVTNLGRLNLSEALDGERPDTEAA